MNLPAPPLTNSRNLDRMINLVKPCKVVSLFNHPQFDTRISRESDIIPDDPKTLPQLYARRVIDFWYELGLPRPYKKTLKKIEDDATSGIVAALKGEHPYIVPLGRKFTLEEIYQSIKNYKIARTDPHYEPISKEKITKKNVASFIYDKWTGKSLLVKYLTPPKPIIREKNPQLTHLLMHHFANAKWGTTAKDIEHEHRFSFLQVSNRIAMYLEQHQHEFQPTMKIGPKNPEAAARGLIACAQQSSNWDNFDPKWLSNDISIRKLDIWLRNQGFFKTAHKTMS